MDEGWRLIMSGLVVDQPGPVGHYLGCSHEMDTIVFPNGTEATRMVYNMEPYLSGTVHIHLLVAQKLMVTQTNLKHVGTPFLQQDQTRQSHEGPVREGSAQVMPMVQALLPSGWLQTGCFFFKKPLDNDKVMIS